MDLINYGIKLCTVQNLSSGMLVNLSNIKLEFFWSAKN